MLKAMAHQQGRKSRVGSGFSLLELVIVMGIMGLIMGMGFSGMQSLRSWMAESRSQGLFLDIQSACRMYRMEHGAWPAPFRTGEISLNEPPANWRDSLGLYMETGPAGEILRDGYGNEWIYLIVDFDEDHWIRGNEFTVLPQEDRPEEIWDRSVVFSLDGEGRLASASWLR